MPYCPSCRSEFRLGIEKCITCDEYLVQELPDLGVCVSRSSMADYLSDKELVVVARGPLAELRQRQELLQHSLVANVIIEDEEFQGNNVHAIYQLAIDQEDLEKVKQVVQDTWQAELSEEGMADVDAELTLDVESGEPIECPACGTTFKPMDKRAECPDCGIMLGLVEE